MIWKVVKHKDLSLAEGLRIAYIKDQHWTYGLESQILWMRDNIEMNDVHLMGEEQVGNTITLKAYITLINIIVIIDDHYINCLGVGGVCVDRGSQHLGVGRLLMGEANKYIRGQHKQGILLCKDTLIEFYAKCGWKLLNFQAASIAGNNYENNIMLLDKDCTCSNIIINKNF